MSSAFVEHQQRAPGFSFGRPQASQFRFNPHAPEFRPRGGLAGAGWNAPPPPHPATPQAVHSAQDLPRGNPRPPQGYNQPHLEGRPWAPTLAPWPTTEHPANMPPLPTAPSFLTPTDQFTTAWIAPWPGVGTRQSAVQVTQVQVLAAVLPAGILVTVATNSNPRGSISDRAHPWSARPQRETWRGVRAEASTYRSGLTPPVAHSSQEAMPAMVVVQDVEGFDHASASWLALLQRTSWFLDSERSNSDNRLISMLAAAAVMDPHGTPRFRRSLSRAAIEESTTTLIYEKAVAPPSSEPKKEEDSEQCSICLEDFEVGERLRVLPCMHRYHCGCVDKWLLRTPSGECPLCRNVITRTYEV